MVIVNSDDFGYSKSINMATKKAFDKGYISSTTLLVNMEGYASAVEMISNNQIDKNSVGLHINLQEGFPLTEEIKNLNLCNSNGVFNYNFRNDSHFFRDKQFLKIVKDEIDSQIVRFKNDIVFLPTHIDSHDHTHTEFFMLKILAEVLSDHRINFLRPTRNIGQIKLYKDIYKQIYQFTGRKYGIKFVDYFGSVCDFQNLELKKDKIYEMEVHCMFKNDVLTDSGRSFKDNEFAFLKSLELKSYRDISKLC
tara:strand:+ start:218 stop:970 length:753 start_codon:yes stop_codon:yes gene_type:complete